MKYKKYNIFHHWNYDESDFSQNDKKIIKINHKDINNKRRLGLSRKFFGYDLNDYYELCTQKNLS